MTDQDYQDINQANAGAPVVPVSSFPRAPKVTANIFDESLPMLFMSTLAYTFTDALNYVTHEGLQLEYPEEVPRECIEIFKEESWDLTKFNGGNGISFKQMEAISELNTEALTNTFESKELDFHVLIPSLAREFVQHNGLDLSKVFLTFNRNAQRDVSCVYTVMKDTNTKKVIVSFRGSRSEYSTRDWQTNFNARLRGLETPDKIKDKMEGRLKERVLVHRGFYNYLFDNDKRKGEQQYDQLIDDIRKVINGEEGYAVYITGHSLGAALAQMCSFTLAGAGPELDDIPRPITCITFAAPYSGSAGYRTATEYLERDGLLRNLRFYNEGDLVPTIPPFSLLRFRLLKHTGINIRLMPDSYLIEHSSNSGFGTAVRMNFAGPVFRLPFGGSKLHSLDVHYERMMMWKEVLHNKTLDDLYSDPMVVSQDYLDGKSL